MHNISLSRPVLKGSPLLMKNSMSDPQSQMQQTSPGAFAAFAAAASENLLQICCSASGEANPAGANSRAKS
jgi:hypothetical protein